MDVVRLGEPGTNLYLPDILIENYASMIWTERFQTPGEFQFITADVLGGLTKLPFGAFISLLDSDEIMMVQTHTIDVDDDGNEMLTITGKTLDAYFDMRHVEGPYNKRRKMARTYSPRSAVECLLWNAFNNNSGVDVTREDDYSYTTKDKVPNLIISDSAVSGVTARRWWLNEGPLGEQLRTILVQGDLGTRFIRPTGGNATRVDVATSLASRGEVSRSNVTDVWDLQLNVFSGTDRSHSQSDVDVVSFSAPRKELENIKYLRSIENYRTACEVMSSVGGSDQYRGATEQAYTGWDRRVMSYDAGEPDIPDGKTDAEKAQIKADFKEDAEKDALRYLKKARKVKLVSGDVSAEAPYIYKKNYDLGDMVSLYGDYDLKTKVTVMEYTRTIDETGEKAYPGLALPNQDGE